MFQISLYSACAIHSYWCVSPSTESDASGILIGVIVSVVVVLMVVMATVIAGWCFFHGCETKSSKSGFPNHPGPVDAQEEFVSSKKLKPYLCSIILCTQLSAVGDYSS